MSRRREGGDGDALRTLLEALDRLLCLPETERADELDRLARERPEQADRLRGLLDRRPAATAWFDGLEQSLGRGLAAELDAAWAPGRQVGPFRLERLLATGGMDAVFLARKADGELKRRVALKLVPPGLIDAEAMARVRRERELLAGLSHPNIASLLDAGVTADGQPWIAMEYVEGQPLDGYWQDVAADAEQGLAPLIALIDAVAFAHRNLVVHGDLKPSNVRVDGEGRARLLDFGVARVLREVGDGDRPRYLTERYAAPELRAGERASVATDIHALGVLIGEWRETLAHLRPSRQRELDAIAARATAHRPEDRYESARELADELRRWQRGRPVEAVRGGAVYRLGKRVGRHPWASVAVVLAAVLLVAFAAVSRFQADRYALERDKAEQLAGFLETLFLSADPDISPGAQLTARALLDRGLARIETERLPPEVQGRFLSILGRTYQRLGDYETAGQLLDRSLSLEGATVEQRTDRAIERAETHRLAGEFDRAEARYTALLAEVPVDDAARQARVRAGLGRTIAQAGRPGEAVELLESGLALTRRLPATSPEVLADRLNDLGSALFRLGRYDEAVARLEEALAHRRALDAALGREPGTPGTATLVNNLGLMHYLQGRPDRAEPLLREALAMRRALLPDDHPDVAQTLTNLGLMLKDYGDVEEAVVLLDEALVVRRAGLAGDHFRIAQARLNLGTAQRAAGRLAAAEPLLEAALDGLVAALGASHPQVAIAHNELGTLRLALGQPDRAAAAHQRALEIQRAALPGGHPHLAWSLVGRGLALQALDDLGAARAAVDEAVAIRRATLPPGDSLLLEAEAVLAGIDAALARDRSPSAPD